jgi:hypothetical protein
VCGSYCRVTVVFEGSDKQMAAPVRGVLTNKMENARPQFNCRNYSIEMYLIYTRRGNRMSRYVFCLLQRNVLCPLARNLSALLRLADCAAIASVFASRIFGLVIRLHVRMIVGRITW